MTNKLPMIGMRGFVILPWQKVPLFIEREKSIHIIQHAKATKQELFCLSQRYPEDLSPNEISDFLEVGCICQIELVIVSPDNSHIKVILKGLRPARICTLDSASEITSAVVEDIPQSIGEIDAESEEILDLAIEHENSAAYLSMLSGAKLDPEMVVAFSPSNRCLLSNFHDSGDVSALIRQFVTLSTIEPELRQNLLEIPNEQGRLVMAKEIVVANLRRNSSKIAELEKELGIQNKWSRR